MADSLTWGELIAQARFLLQDRDSDRYRYSDENLLAACHLACLTVKQIRPDIFFDTYRLSGENSPCFPAPPYDDAATRATLMATTSPMPDIYQQPTILFITGYAELVNEEFAGTDRASSLLSSFKAQLVKSV